MTRILATFALLAATTFMVPPSSADAAPQSARGVETDRAATAPTDVSAQRRRVYRQGYRYYPYAYWGPYPGAYPQRAYAYGSYRPYPYAYREWYWGPRLFPYGPWW
jgi:hypothetical protein